MRRSLIRIDKELERVSKQFTVAYNCRLRQLQAVCKDNETLYTKLPLSFALLNNLCYLELLFHPKSLEKLPNSETLEPVIRDYKEILEEIIIYELKQDIDKGALTSEQLHKVIEVFGKL